MLTEYKIAEHIPFINDLLTSEDFRWITDQPVRVDTATELRHLNIHREAVEQSNVESWGFKQSTEKLSRASGYVDFVAFKASGYSAKVYLDDVTEELLGLVVIKRQSPAPSIDSVGRAMG